MIFVWAFANCEKPSKAAAERASIVDDGMTSKHFQVAWLEEYGIERNSVCEREREK